MVGMYMFETRTATQRAIVLNAVILMGLYIAYKQGASAFILAGCGIALLFLANGLLIYFATKR